MLIGSYWPRCSSLDLYTLAKRLNMTFSRTRKGVLCHDSQNNNFQYNIQNMIINLHPTDRVLTFFSILYPIDFWDYQWDFIIYALLICLGGSFCPLPVFTF